MCTTASIRDCCWVIRKETFPEDAVRAKEHIAVSTLLCSEALGCACAAMGRAWGLCSLFGGQNESSPLWVPNPAPSGLEPHSLVPKPAEIGAGGITLCLWAEECPNWSCHLLGLIVSLILTLLWVSLPGKLSCSTQSASCCRASILQTLKVVKDPQWMSHSLGGSKPVCKRRSHWEKGAEEKEEI